MEGESNPLKNSVILDNIFVKLRVKDQKRFRLVNKLWEKNSVERWRRTVQIQITIDMGTTRKLGQFLDFWENSENEGHPHPLTKIPFRNFKITSNWRKMVGLRGTVDCSPLLEEFWEFCSPKMESLSLNGIYWKRGFLPTVKWILLECEAAGEEGRRGVELKELIVQNCKFNSRNNSKRAPKKLDVELEQNNTEIAKKLTSLKLDRNLDLKADEVAGLLQLVPNLKNLCGLWDRSYEVLKALVLASSVATKNKKNQIELEELRSNLHPDSMSIPLLLKYMEAAQPKFKKLNLDLWACKEESLFNKFMRNPCASITLTKLEVYVILFGRYLITDFTGFSFPQLKEFRLNILTTVHNPTNIEQEQRKVRFDFKAFYGMQNLKSFVCLQKATASEDDDSLRVDELMSEGKDKWMGEQEVEVERLQLDKLEEFDFELVRNFDEDSLREVALWMKNLKKLNLVFKNENIFKAAFKLWPDLEEVDIVKGSNVPERFIEEVKRGNRSVKIYQDGYLFNKA